MDETREQQLERHIVRALKAYGLPVTDESVSRLPNLNAWKVVVKRMARLVKMMEER